MAGDSQSPPKQAPSNPAKYFKHFMFKPLLITVFLVSLLLLPPQAPEFLGQSLGSTIWEILQLVFVGIAVSYGLFSWKSEYPDKESAGEAKFESAHSFVSGLLQVSSVFDDDDGGGGGGSGGISVMDEKIDGSCRNIVQTWSNQCRKGEPMAVSGVEEQRGFCVAKEISRIGEKPLLLPVRSLKSRIEDDVGGKIERNGSVNKEVGEENPVLPSPIPWRSRSGRIIQMKQDSKPPSEPELADVPGDNYESRSHDGSRDDDDDDDGDHQSGAEDDYHDDGDHSSGDEEDDEEGRDVDKKAAEFIAKFKEQIRMQRVDSIKKSAGC